jgi:hypothetical protein
MVQTQYYGQMKNILEIWILKILLSNKGYTTSEYQTKENTVDFMEGNCIICTLHLSWK